MEVKVKLNLFFVYTNEILLYIDNDIEILFN